MILYEFQILTEVHNKVLVVYNRLIFFSMFRFSRQREGWVPTDLLKGRRTWQLEIGGRLYPN